MIANAEWSAQSLLWQIPKECQKLPNKKYMQLISLTVEPKCRFINVPQINYFPATFTHLATSTLNTGLGRINKSASNR